MDTTKSEVVIMGGGPAGISCAIWLQKLGVPHRLLEASDRLGGLQTRSPYENLWLPGVQGKTGQQIAQGLSDHAHAVGVTLETNCPVLDVIATERGYHISTPCGDRHASHLVIATGTRPCAGGFTPSETVAIGPGEPMEALSVRGQRIAILGGGDNAFDQARFVRDRGAAEVVIYSRRQPRAQSLLQAMIPEVRIITGAFKARQSDMTINDDSFDAFGVMYGFEAVVPPGLSPRRNGGYIRVNQKGETNLRHVYACGEVTNYWHPCVATASAHGIQVAKQISKAISGAL